MADERNLVDEEDAVKENSTKNRREKKKREKKEKKEGAIRQAAPYHNAFLLF